MAMYKMETEKKIRQSLNENIEIMAKLLAEREEYEFLFR